MNHGNTAASVCVCTYNRAARLPALIRTLRAQPCPVPFEVLVVNNNSTDETARVLEQLGAEPGAPLRCVLEPRQGIVFARNRAISEALDREFLIFIDDDELPAEGHLTAALRCFEADSRTGCVGGRIEVDFSQTARPRWLGDELLGFLGKVDWGGEAFWVTDEETPLWSGNIAYRMAVFRDDPSLRFDLRYNREGLGIGGGEDVLMFREFLARGIPMRYCPDMVVKHAVDPWRLRRSYFLKVHYSSGFKAGRWDAERYSRTVAGVPLFLFQHLLRDLGRTLAKAMAGKGGVLRQAMTAAYTFGSIRGYHARAAADGTGKPASTPDEAS